MEAVSYTRRSVSEITRRETAGAEIKDVFGPLTGHGEVGVFYSVRCLGDHQTGDSGRRN